DAKSKDAAPVPTGSAGSSGLAEKTDGILLRFNPDKREWERLADSSPLNRSDRLLCLPPFRASITLGKMSIVMLGGTEVRILSQSSDTVPSLELVQGRLLIRQPSSSALKVAFANRTASLSELSSDNSLALERV